MPNLSPAADTAISQLQEATASHDISLRKLKTCCAILADTTSKLAEEMTLMTATFTAKFDA